MEPDILLDTNVLLRHVLQDHADHSPRSLAFFELVEQGEQVVRLVDTVVFETVYTLERSYGVQRQEISDVLQPLLRLPGVVLPGKRIYGQVFDLWLREPSLSFADSYHLCMAHQLGISKIMTFDRKLNRHPAVERIEP
ncbi:MAG TPA: PIN domain-containing protein [Thermomicrobiales bacterium]|nr:PIN domain-containing protein [Thermomicrobiales bacterium]